MAAQVTNLFFTHAGAPLGCDMTANRAEVALRVEGFQGTERAVTHEPAPT